MCTKFDKEEIDRISDIFAETVIKKLKEYHQVTLLMDVDTLAAYLNVPKSWVYERTRHKGNGSIPRIKVGKYTRFNIQDVLEWLKNQ